MDAKQGGLAIDSDYSETISLSAGRAVRLRLLHPEDREELLRGFERLSAESRYHRFLSSKPQLSERELDYLSDVDGDRHVAIGAWIAEGRRRGDGVGVGRFVRLPDAPRTAEAAVTIVDQFQGQGLGRELFERLVLAARERGVERFRATLFRENRPMRRLLESVIGDVEIVENNGPVVTLGMDLDRDSVSSASLSVRGSNAEDSSTGGPYRLLSLSAEGFFSLWKRALRMRRLMTPCRTPTAESGA